MGNRGRLHDEHRRIVRFTQVPRWLACVLEFRGRHRQVMRPGYYTELFFLDEATAFAAGHRPCAECRSRDYRRFRSLWETLFGAPATAGTIDARLDEERRDGDVKRTHRAGVATLPDGTYVAVDGVAWLVAGDALLAWSPHGYTRRVERPRDGDVDVLTPRSIVAVLAAGYQPERPCQRYERCVLIGIVPRARRSNTSSPHRDRRRGSPRRAACRRSRRSARVALGAGSPRPRRLLGMPRRRATTWPSSSRRACRATSDT